MLASLKKVIVMSNAIGLTFKLTHHAKQRYQERCPNGLGLIQEAQSSRTCTKRQYKEILKQAPWLRHKQHASRGCSKYTAWLSKDKTIIITSNEERGVIKIITCWKYNQ